MNVMLVVPVCTNPVKVAHKIVTVTTH